MPIQKFSRNSKGENGIVDPRELFGNLSHTNHYQVDFSSLTTFSGNNELVDHLKNPPFNVDLDFISRKSGLLCSEASLPGTSLATSEVKDNFMGIPQEFAHTRLYTDFDFTFYVDNDYNNLKFFEGWIDYISSGSEIPGPNGDGTNILQSNYYRRIRYPDSYKCQTVSITKFERNYGKTLKYSFINVFPKLISSIPVSYGPADILRVSVSFNYDRYVINSEKGFSKGQRTSFVEGQQQQDNKRTSLTQIPVQPYTPPTRQSFGNTYGPGTAFVERDPATGVRMDGVAEPEPITYRQELGLDPL